MIRILQGDCIEVLATLPADSIDAVVTDPPYHLQSIVKRFGAPNAAPAQFGTDGAYARMSKGFMGKQWDGGDVAFRPETWAAVLRVLKPGGYMVCFASTRGYHRMVCAIEDAGFIIHPMLGWIFGSGFPKATNLSKQLDKAAGAVREVIEHRTLNNNRFATSGSGQEQEQFRKFDGNASITAPATPEAKQWEGWAYGLQSLKPALEPICMAQKPAIREGMVANVLKYGTGAINVDACKIKTSQSDQDYINELIGGFNKTRSIGGNGILGGGQIMDRSAAYDASKGRWPANVLHDGSPEVEAAFAAFGNAPGQSGSVTGHEPSSKTNNVYGQFNGRPDTTPRGDSGTASRFFYAAKASKHDRAGSKHPTIKPVALIRYLCRLITPPNGTILDPFAGSGTTAEAAMIEGFSATLIERDPASVADIRHRIERWSGGDAPLFADIVA